jgi:AraC-like DNA-binding protein
MLEVALIVETYFIQKGVKMARPKNLKGGRPQIPIDEKMLENLTKLHLSIETIAKCLGVSSFTLDRRYAPKMAEWREQSRSKIANVLFDEAINKREPWALKTIAQRHLGYADKVQTESSVTHRIEQMTDDQLDKRIKELEKLIKENE